MNHYAWPLIAQCPFAVAIHVCRGRSNKVLLDGLDYALKAQLTALFEKIGVPV